MIEAYPLYWPEGRPRTSKWERGNARFEATFARARDDVIREIKLLVGGTYQLDIAEVIISTNLPLRRDGLPLANQRQPEDTGVAVYFNYNKTPVSFACDRWKKIEDNMRAVALTIDALRGIARWGTGDMMEAAFRGFTALPSPEDWRAVLEVGSGPVHRLALESQYRMLRSKHHPDKGGNAERFQAVQRAWEQACRELGI